MGGGGVLGFLSLVYKRLFTKEDSFSFHKILGISCLVHFVGRFVRVGSADMGFDSSMTTAASLLMHLLLSVSSLIFHIPKQRIKEGSRIWPEYRLHSIIFACRSLACMALIWAEARYGLAPNYWWNAAIVLLTHAAADVASWSVGDAHSSSVQDLDAPAALRFFFSVLQFNGTAGCLLGIRRYQTQFTYVFIIQVTAFLMTLRRKNLAPHMAIIWIYGAMLAFGFGVATYDAMAFNSWLLLQTVTNSAATLRMHFRVDKYAIWAGFAVLLPFARECVAAPSGECSFVSLLPVLWPVSVCGVLHTGKCYLAAKAKAVSNKAQ